MTPAHSPLPGRASAWLVPLVTFLLGAVILVAEAANDDVASGIAWFAVLSAIAAVLAFGGRFQAVREARGETEDERDAMINTQAMAATGTVLMVGLTGAIVYALLRGDDLVPYVPLAAAGGATYAVALLTLRRRS
jgi:hypothetical protein